MTCFYLNKLFNINKSVFSAKVELLPKTPSSKRTRRKLNTSARVSGQGLCAERKSRRLSGRQRRENSIGSDANLSQRSAPEVTFVLSFYFIINTLLLM